MTFNFSDEDGFISIVNAERYKGFVDSDWKLEQLFNHFTDQMNERNLIIWTSNQDGGNEWEVEILNQPSSKEEFRSFNFPICVTNNCLYLVSYTDLTMAAQFEDEIVPAKHGSHLKFDISDGLYDVTIRQMFNPKELDYEAEMIHFEIVFNVTNTTEDKKANKVFWWEE